MIIEVQFLLTYCIDRVIGHDFTYMYPWNCDFQFIHENWYPQILMKPQYHFNHKANYLISVCMQSVHVSVPLPGSVVSASIIHVQSLKRSTSHNSMRSFVLSTLLLSHSRCAHWMCIYKAFTIHSVIQYMYYILADNNKCKYR